MEMENDSLVSIVIPAYNPDYFEEAFLSAINQTYEKTEIIICDDSTSDLIFEKVFKYKDHPGFSRVKYEKNLLNIGEKENYIKCFNLASGEYLKFLNDDDVLHPNCISRMVSLFQKNEKVALITSKRKIIDNESRMLGIFPLPFSYPEKNKYIYFNGFEMGDLLLTNISNFIGEPSTVLFRKKALEPVKDTLFSLNEKPVLGNGDITLWLNILQNSDGIFICEALSSFRKHPKQSQQNLNNKFLCIFYWYIVIAEAEKMGFLAKNHDKLKMIVNVITLFKSELNESLYSDEQNEILITKIKELEVLKGTLFEEIDKENKYSCPVCGSDFPNFLPIPSYYAEQGKKYGFPHKSEDFETINTEQYSCPVCGASDRDRLYAMYFSKKIAGDTSGYIYNVIEFAPSRPLTEFIRKYPQYHLKTADLFMEGVDDKIDITKMDIYPTNYFDIFICSHILEHIQEEKKAIAELFRILKPGGWGIVMVPIHLGLEQNYEDFTKTTEAERWKHFGQNDHVRLHAKKDFINNMVKAGFNVSEFGVEFFGAENFKKYGITNRSILYIAEIPASVNSLIERAFIAFNQKNYILAEGLFGKLLSYDNKDRQYLYHQAKAQFYQEKYESCLVNLAEIIKTVPLNYELCIYMSQALEKVGDIRTSEIFYKKARQFI